MLAVHPKPTMLVLEMPAPQRLGALLHRGQSVCVCVCVCVCVWSVLLEVDPCAALGWTPHLAQVC